MEFKDRFVEDDTLLSYKNKAQLLVIKQIPNHCMFCQRILKRQYGSGICSSCGSKRFIELVKEGKVEIKWLK